MIPRAILAVPLAAALAAGCQARPDAKLPELPPPPPPAIKVLDDLSMLAVGAPLPEAEGRALARQIASGKLTLEAYVQTLLADPRFSREVAPEIVFNKRAVDLSEEDAWEPLQRTADRPPIFYLRKPCPAGEAVRVHPRWSLDSEVLVCPDAYRPDHLRQPETGWYCGGTNLDASRSPFCGCGPNLVSCARDEAHVQAIRRGLQRELTLTVAHVVERDRPLADLFTMNETVRTTESEIFYQRWELVQGRRAAVDARAWPREGKLAPRPEAVPGQHAGLLTAPHVLLYGDTPRARMRNAFADLWCVTPSSVDVPADLVLSLGVTDLRDGDGWRKLAAMPVCTDCHARLDHGMQFFAGYPSSFVGVIYEPPPDRAERGQLYGFGHQDLRGEGPLTPRAFAELAVKQPELGRCMARDVADHVWNGDATPEDRRALVQAFDREGTLRALMREALLRFARRALSGVRPAAPPTPPADDLRARLDAHCQACHDGGSHPIPRRGPIDPALLSRMIRQVAYGDMPKAPAELAPEERRSLLRALVDARWQDPASRREAMRHFDGGWRGLRVHRGSALLGLVEQRAGGHDAEASSWTFSDADRHDVEEVRPSLVTTFALAALRACKAAGHSGAALDACLRRALDVGAAVKGPAR